MRGELRDIMGTGRTEMTMTMSPVIKNRLAVVVDMSLAKSGRVAQREKREGVETGVAWVQVTERSSDVPFPRPQTKEESEEIEQSQCRERWGIV